MDSSCAWNKLIKNGFMATVQEMCDLCITITLFFIIISFSHFDIKIIL